MQINLRGVNKGHELFSLQKENNLAVFFMLIALRRL